MSDWEVAPVGAAKPQTLWDEFDAMAFNLKQQAHAPGVSALEGRALLDVAARIESVLKRYPRSAEGGDKVTTLNARANQAWRDEIAFEPTDDEAGFSHQRAAFEEGWETGYKAAAEAFVAALEDEWRQAPAEYQAGLYLAVKSRTAALKVIRGES